MRWRRLSRICTTMMVLAAAVWLGWSRWSVTPVAYPPAPIPPVLTQSRAPGDVPPPLAQAEVTAGHAAGLFSYRLTNTPLSVGELARRDTGLLLENALLDTANPSLPEPPPALQSPPNPGSYIVQARGPLTDAFREQLRRAGAVVVAYIPNNAYLVRASVAGAGQLAGESGIQAVLPYEPYYKIRPSLLKGLLAELGSGKAANRAGDEPVGCRVLLFDDLAAGTREALTGLDVQVLGGDRSPFGPVVNIQLPLARVPDVARLPGVQEIERLRTRVPANDLSRVTLGVAAAPGVATNYLGLTGDDVRLAVIDTGVDAGHPDLAGRVFTDRPVSGVDTNGHGTQVAGIIAGSGLESPTVTNASGSGLPAVPGQFRGKAPAADLFSVALNPPDSAPGSDSALQQMAVTNGAFISNNSWEYAGGSEYDLAAASYDAAVRDALPGRSGPQPLLLVFAAGNNGAGQPDGTGGSPDTILSPATAKNVITVGALEQLRTITNRVWFCTGTSANEPGVCVTNPPWLAGTDSSQQVAAFSSRGNVGIGIEGDYGRFKPDVVAPGSFIVSTRSAQAPIGTPGAPTNGLSNYSEVWTSLNAGLGPFYGYASGSSLAAAAVSGTLALMQEFFEHRLQVTNSPALMKALLINGAQPATTAGGWDLRSVTNAQGWGRVSLPASLPAALSNLNSSAGSAVFAFDQSPSRALTTGQRQTWFLRLATAAQSDRLRVTLDWTDPPASPAAAIKLVNDLDLIVTNLDTGEVFCGNAFAPGTRDSQPQTPGSLRASDNINNVENVFLAPPVGKNLSVTVLGRRVNVNAVSAQADGVAQDFALVISSGDGQLAGAIKVSDAPPVDEPFPLLTSLNALDASAPAGFLMDQRAGAPLPPADFPWIPFAGGAAGAMNVGETNQWHFHVVTNTTEFTNLVFLTFAPRRLAWEGFDPAHGTPAVDGEPDIDLYVSVDPGLTNLDPGALAAANKSLGRGGTETVMYSNAVPGIYYVGVKSESGSAAQYSFFAAASELPFAEIDSDGSQVLRGVPVPAVIPQGTAAVAGRANALAVSPFPGVVHRVIVTNTVSHSSPPDLAVALAHDSAEVTLAEHPAPPAWVDRTIVYDDSSEVDLPGATRSDGPGSLQQFAGGPTEGQWRLALSSTNHPGTNENFSLRLEVQTDPVQGMAATLLPGACREDRFVVPAEATNVVVKVDLTAGSGPLWLQVYPADQDPAVTLPEPVPGAVTVDRTSRPPLHGGEYVIRLCNPGTESAGVNLHATLGLDSQPVPVAWFGPGGPMSIPDDAECGSAIAVTTCQRVLAAEVGVRINHPRVSDLALTLVSPSGKRVLLAENRGGLSTNGLGSPVTVTNVAQVSSTGGPEVSTNHLDTGGVEGLLHIGYDFFDLPDDMRVYYEGSLLFDSGMVSGSNSVDLAFGPGNSTVVTIVMNEGGNWDTNTVWVYSVTATRTVQALFTFTEDPTLASTPIKFVVPPFTGPVVNDLASGTTNRIFCVPEQSLGVLEGESSQGEWKLELRDSRVGPVGPVPRLVAWDLGLKLAETVPLPAPLSLGIPRTNRLGAGEVQWFSVSVPGWAGFATNRLMSATSPLDVWFNAAAVPTGTNAGDVRLLNHSLGGSATLQTNGSPALVPGTTYYLGVRNPGTTAATFAFGVDFNLTRLIGGQPATSAGGLRPAYFYFDVSAQATAVSFQLTDLTEDATLVVSHALPLPDDLTFDYRSANPGTNDESVLLFPDSTPAPVAPGRWYVGVLSASGVAGRFRLVATEYTNAIPPVTTLYSGVPYAAYNAGPWLAADCYRFTVTPEAARAQFDLYQASTDFTLVARKGLPLPTLSSFDLLSANPGTSDESIVLYDFSSPVRLSPGDWFITAVNLSGESSMYFIKATEYPVWGTNLLITNYVEESNSLCVTWTSLPGAHYFVEAASDPAGSWVTVSPTVTASDVSSTWCLPLPSDYNFLRVREGLVPVPATGAVPVRQVVPSPGRVLLEWTGSTTSRFQVQWSDALSGLEWKTFSSVISSATGLFQFTDDGSQTGGVGPARFYRLVEVP